MWRNRALSHAAFQSAACFSSSASIAVPMSSRRALSIAMLASQKSCEAHISWAYLGSVSFRRFIIANSSGVSHSLSVAAVAERGGIDDAPTVLALRLCVLHNLRGEAPTKRNEPIRAHLALLHAVAKRFLVLLPVFLLEIGNNLIPHLWRDGHVIEAVPGRAISKTVEGWSVVEYEFAGFHLSLHQRAPLPFRIE
jgi:hypothetical protein